MGPSVAYFSMEIALAPDLPTYAGGLGVLAGDALRAAADLGMPLVGVTLAHRDGYFHQRLDESGVQSETPETWSPAGRLEPVEARVEVEIEGRAVAVTAWRHTVRGLSSDLPVYLLDTDLPGNDPPDREITSGLYRGELADRLKQSVVLGMGGVAFLEALGLDIEVFHLNEGHSAFLTLALLEREAEGRGRPTSDAFEAVRRRCVFTTHTPVPAGHDRFPGALLRPVIGPRRTRLLEASGGFEDDTLNMTLLALRFSRHVNGVSQRHRQVSLDMFPGHAVDAITNGVHAGTWVSPPFAELFDRRLPAWRRHTANLRHAVSIPFQEIREAHGRAKRELLAEVERRTGRVLDPGAATIGFARRATTYKRADLLFTDLDRLRRIAAERGPLQVLYAGKAHPRDEAGKAMIRRVFEGARALGDALPVVYLEDYGMDLARLVCAGVDVWLNTPLKPLEASGTSGMKAALNGVPSLSVLDGWWIEGHVEGVTGWSIGEEWETTGDPAAEAAALYDKLEGTVLPLFHDRPEAWVAVMRGAIALNGSFFTAERMLHQYDLQAYRRSDRDRVAVGDPPARASGELRDVT